MEDGITNGDGALPASEPAPVNGRVTSVAPIWHTVLLVVVLLGLAVLQGQPQLAGNTSRLPSRVTLYLFTIGYELFLLGYVWLLGLMLRRVPLSEIIGGKWKRLGDFWRDVGIALLFWIVVGSVLAVMSYTLHFSGMEAAKFMLPETPIEIAVFVLLAWVAGFCEEIVFRGYLQRQFTAWTGNVAVGVILQSAVFGSAHLYQGLKGVVVITVYGALFGILASMRKSLRPGMMQHGAQDTLSGIAGVFLKKYHYLQVIKF